MRWRPSVKKSFREPVLIKTDPWVYVVGALLLLILPLDWLTAAFLAAVFHELCHIGMIRLLGGRIFSVDIRIGGAVIEAELPGEKAELLSAMAGPVGSFLLLSMCRIFPKLAIAACIQGLFNLIPLYPLDGGRILKCSLNLLCPAYAERIRKGIEVLVHFLVGMLSVGGCVLYSQGAFPILFAALVIRKPILRKIPCKRRQIRVQ